MVVNPEEFRPFLDWLAIASLWFVIALPVLALLGIFLWYLLTTIRHGPVEAFYLVGKVLLSAIIEDLPHTSLRRIGALTALAVREAVRRKVIVVFILFLVVLLFAGWFLDVESDHPAALYLSFVLTASNYLVLALVLFISAFSLPTDIKQHTIYTIVTKPVRANEIIAGRVLGFALVGTVLLLMMCGVSYLFVVRGVAHRHSVAEMGKILEEDVEYEGKTSTDAYHHHVYNLGSQQRGITTTVKGHWHEVQRTGEGESAQHQVGPPRDMLLARVPVYGRLRFLDEAGRPGAGTNVGKEWDYRKYIAGGSLATAVWRFSGMTPEQYPESLPVELNLRVFRTTKGDIVSGVLGTIVIKNPDPAARVQETAPIYFRAKEYELATVTVPFKDLRYLEAREGGDLREVDFFRDLAPKGEVEVLIRCAEPAQYFGMAQADLYLRAADVPFWWNFFKGYVGIWLQMLIVTAFGVMFSTFLSGPVAAVATLATLVLGFFSDFVVDFTSGSLGGGGPVESFIRVITQKNTQVDLDLSTVAAYTVESVDTLLNLTLGLFVTVLPDYVKFNMADKVAYGFNIYGDLLSRYCVVTFVYVLVVSLVAYLLFKTRELAA